MTSCIAGNGVRMVAEVMRMCGELITGQRNRFRATRCAVSRL